MNPCSHKISYRQQNVIDVAIKKLETLQQQIQRLKSEKRVGMWENVTKRLIVSHGIFEIILKNYYPEQFVNP